MLRPGSSFNGGNLTASEFGILAGYSSAGGKQKCPAHQALYASSSKLVDKVHLDNASKE